MDDSSGLFRLSGQAAAAVRRSAGAQSQHAQRQEDPRQSNVLRIDPASLQCNLANNAFHDTFLLFHSARIHVFCDNYPRREASKVASKQAQND